MRGPRIRKIAYVPEAERPVRNDLVRVLTAATASFYPKDARGDAMHAERWRVRIHRTRDLGKLRYTASSVHLANNHPVKWHKDQPKRWPALPAVLTAIRRPLITTTFDGGCNDYSIQYSWPVETSRPNWRSDWQTYSSSIFARQ